MRIRDIPNERIQRMARALHEEGEEYTPQEVRDTLELGLHKIRQNLKELGWLRIPESDVVLLDLIYEMQSEE